MKFATVASVAALLAAASPALAGLRDLPPRIYVGVALDPTRLTIPAYEKIAREEFNSIVPENAMKWESTEKERGVFSFEDADAVVEFAEKNDQRLRGHTLVWHSQLAPWVSEGNFTSTELLDVMKVHIDAVVGRYKGRIAEWDVTNEIVSDNNGEYRDSIFLNTVGIEGYKEAFKLAHTADPNALLFMNDYNIEGINAKSDTYYELAKEMIEEGIPVHGIGMQAHYVVGTVPTDIKENIERFTALGLAVSLTEIDVRIPEPFTEEKLAQQATDVATLINACEAVCGCRGVTIWGVDDGHSWVPGVFEGEGSALIFDDDYMPKPSYYGAADALSEDNSGCVIVSKNLKTIKNRLYIGVALDPTRLSISDYERIAKDEFNSIVPENAMKWESTEKERGVFSYEDADKVVEFAQSNGQQLRGHTLVWHSQLAPWVEAGNFSKTEMLSILENHIRNVVGRYKGIIKEWDVTNEIVSDNEGEYRQSIWLDTIGIEGYKFAFKIAHEVDPDAILFMNDYNVEGINAKSDRYYELAKEMLAEGIPLSGFGMQGHYIVGTLPPDVQENIQRFVDLGLKVSITEVDIRIPEPFTHDKAVQQGKDFAAIIDACEAVCGCLGVTVWGVDDGHSWIPGVFPAEGSALLYDNIYRPKLAYNDVVAAYSTDSSPAECKMSFPSGSHGHGRYPGHGKADGGMDFEAEDTATPTEFPMDDEDMDEAVYGKDGTFLLSGGSSGSESGVSTPVVAGLAVGGACALLVVGGVVAYAKRRSVNPPTVNA